MWKTPLHGKSRRRFAFTAPAWRWTGLALAVAIVIALVIPALKDGQTEERGGLTYAEDALDLALSEQLVADQRLGTETRILLTFKDKNGSLCRGFVRANLSGIACRKDNFWHLRVQRDGVDISGNDNRQAASVDKAIMEAARRMASGSALDAIEERAAKSRGWTGQ